MEAGESHAFFGLDLFVAIEWSDLHLRTLQGWQVLLFTFESALSINCRMTSLAMNSGYRFESMQSSGMRQLLKIALKESIHAGFRGLLGESKYSMISFNCWIGIAEPSTIEPPK